MVKAVNDAGETQSIADFIVLEPTPEPTIDIIKTVAVENIEGQRVCIFRFRFTHDKFGKLFEVSISYRLKLFLFLY